MQTQFESFDITLLFIVSILCLVTSVLTVLKCLLDTVKECIQAAQNRKQLTLQGPGLPRTPEEARQVTQQTRARHIAEQIRAVQRQREHPAPTPTPVKPGNPARLRLAPLDTVELEMTDQGKKPEE